MGNRAVIYARYSSEKQNEQSIDGQLRVCREFAERNGYIIINNYIDRAISGTTDQRHDFQKMIKDSENGAFDYVIVYKLDRFARNRYDSAINKAQLNKNGVKVLSACEQITDSPEGIILESMIEGYAEYYSAELSQKVKRGQIESCLKGNAAGVFAPFGYKLINKKYEIHDDEAIILRKIFNDYVNGLSIKEIRDWLNSNNIKTHQNKKFTSGAISYILHNKKYIGKFLFAGVEYENIIPPIISNQLFQKAQLKSNEYKYKSARMKSATRFILSGKLICAECGNLIVGESGTCRNGDIHYFYKCALKKKNTKNCASHSVSKNFIEDKIYSLMDTAMNDEKFIKRIARQSAEIYNANLKESSTLKILKKQLLEVDKKLNNIMEAICNGIYNNLTQAKMAELDKIKGDIETEIAIEESRIIHPINESDVITFLKRYTEYAKKEQCVDNLIKRKQLFDMFIDNVIYDGKNILITVKTMEDDPYETKKIDKKEVAQTRFEQLRFGAGSRT